MSEIELDLDGGPTNVRPLPANRDLWPRAAYNAGPSPDQLRAACGSDPGYRVSPRIPTLGYADLITACETRDELVALHAVLKTLPEAWKGPLRPVFCTQRDRIARALNPGPDAATDIRALPQTPAQEPDMINVTVQPGATVILQDDTARPPSVATEPAMAPTVAVPPARNARGTEPPSTIPVPAPQAPARKLEIVDAMTRAMANSAPTFGAQLVSEGVVAGAAAEGFGILVSWSGAGEMRRSALLEALDGLGLRGLAPAPRSAHAHAGRAVGLLAQRGYTVRAARGRSRAGENFRARWTIGNVRHHAAKPGDSYGVTVLVVTLGAGDVLTFDHDPEHKGLADSVRAEYERTTGEESYPPGDVTYWMAGVLIGKYQAVKLGGTWYIPREHAAAAEAFCTAIRDAGGGWGAAWMLPALPIATTAQLRQGLSRGLVEEAAAVLADLEARQAEAKAEGRSGIGERAATRLLGDIEKVDTRARSYAVLLGDDAVRQVMAAIAGAREQIAPLVSDGARRGALLELDDAPAKRGVTSWADIARGAAS